MKWITNLDETNSYPELANNDDCIAILNRIWTELRSFFACSTNKQMSTWVKDLFHDLGKELGYKVYGNGISPKLKEGGYFKNREWLYDLHWFTEPENTHYIPATIPMVLESEWQNKQPGNKETRNGAVMFDFQKLLVTNAPLRVMVFKIAKKSDIDYLGDYFDLAIRSYQHLQPGALFLMLGFNRRLKKLNVGFYKT